jgi:hypothetical protein
MDQRLSLVTLGVGDVSRAQAFYEALGWHLDGGVDDETDHVAFFQAGGLIVALWDVESSPVIAAQPPLVRQRHGESVRLRLAGSSRIPASSASVASFQLTTTTGPPGPTPTRPVGDTPSATWRRPTMEPTDHDTRRARRTSTAPDTADRGGATVAAGVASEQPLGPHAAQILGTEHWSLLAARSLIWNEAMSRATVFLTVLSAAIIALALLADATGFGAQTTTLALVLLPVVFLLGLAAHARLVQINAEELQLVLAMNRLRHAYLELEPGLERYLTAGHHDDERGVLATYLLDRPTRTSLGASFALVNTPTIVATVDAALAAAIVVLVLQAVEAPRAVLVAGGAVAFLAVWGVLFRLQLQSLRPFRNTTPRFPTPPDLA